MNGDASFLAGLALIVVAGSLVLWSVLRGQQRQRMSAEDRRKVFDQLAETEGFLTGRVLGSVARPIMGRGGLSDLAESEELGWLQRMLLAAGSPYGGSVEVFLSFQAAAVLVGLAAAIGGSMLTIFPVWLPPVLGVSIMFMPFSRLYDQSKKRAARILADLPDFVDLLMIPIVSGTGIRRSLRETADRFYGPVRTEVMNAISMVEVGRPLGEALWYAGHRLAVPEAKVFFAALAQAEEQGSSVREMLERQRDSLRYEAHQRARAGIKKIPTKIVIVFGLHFMPVLFALALLPLVAALGSL